MKNWQDLSIMDRRRFLQSIAASVVAACAPLPTGFPRSRDDRYWSDHFCVFPAFGYWELDGRPVSSEEARYGLHPRAKWKETEIAKNFHRMREMQYAG